MESLGKQRTLFHDDGDEDDGEDDDDDDDEDDDNLALHSHHIHII